MKCKICGKDIKRLSMHVRVHKLTPKEYYDKYLRGPNEGICPICGKPTNYFRFSFGYYTYCSWHCQLIDRWKRKEIRNAHSNRNTERNKLKWKEEEYREIMRIHKIEAECTWLKNRKCIHLFFYIKILENDIIKIGATLGRLQTRHWEERNNINPIKRLFWIGLKNEVAEFEKFIKINYKPLKGHEFYSADYLNEFMNLADRKFIRSNDKSND